MITFLHILAGVLVAIALVLMLWRRWFPSAVAAYGAMAYSFAIGGVGSSEMILWGVTAAICVALFYLQRQPARLAAPELYTAAGALVGSMLGLLLHTEAAIVLGSALGAALGAIAFRFTPKGRSGVVDMARYFQMLFPCYLQAIATSSMICLAI